MTEATSKKKLSLKEFIWLGFNYTVGIGFIGNFYALSNVGSPHAIGANAIWVYLIIAFVAGNCAWAFARMARIHNSDSNGAAYIYVRTNFGRFLGWLVGFMQYVALPFIITIQILFLIRGTFSQEFVSQGKAQWYTINWGNFTDLYLDLIGIAIYLVAASAIFGGIKLYKKLAHTTGVIKWGTASFLVIAAIALAINSGSANYHHWIDNSPLSITGFMNTFTSCFFFFAGFEIFATAGKNVENPEKNIGKGITLIILISLIFYIIVSIIFFLAYSKFEQNMNMGAWIPFNSSIIKYGGPIIMIISGIAMKINIAMQNALYGGTSLQPLSQEGYISSKLFALNKDGIPVKASILNLVITCVMIALWLIIPDLIKGIYLTVNHTTIYKSPFNVATLTSASSIITIFVYLMVLTTVMKLFTKKQIVLNWYEKIIFPIIFVFLLLIVFWHYYTLIDDTLTAMKTPDTKISALIGMIVEFVFMFSSVGFAIIWYFVYYVPKYNKRLKANPDEQVKLDQQFAFNEEHMATLNTNQETEVII